MIVADVAVWCLCGGDEVALVVLAADGVNMVYVCCWLETRDGGQLTSLGD